MKFKVELEDFWLDEDEDIIPALKQHIIRSVVLNIDKSLAKKIEDTITRQVKLQVESQLFKKTNKMIDEFIATGKIKGDYSTADDLSIKDYIEKQFHRKNGWGNPKDQIEKLAEKFGSDLRNRYDLLFATQIVKKLDHQGLLKDEAIKALLKEN